MSLPKNEIFLNAEDFFMLKGSVWMRMVPAAAVEVCIRAAAEGLVVARIEGGIWHSPGFEARHDCIWDGADPPISEPEAHLNNLLAANFIRAEMDNHDVFILTAPPITGWAHKY